MYRFIVQVDIKVKCLEPLPAASSSVAAGWLLDNSGSCHRRPAVRRRRYSIRRVHRFAIDICLRDMNCGLSMLCADVSRDLDSLAGVITLNSALGWSALVFLLADNEHLQREDGREGHEPGLPSVPVPVIICLYLYGVQGICPYHDAIRTKSSRYPVEAGQQELSSKHRNTEPQKNDYVKSLQGTTSKAGSSQWKK